MIWLLIWSKIRTLPQFIGKCPLCALCLLLALWGAWERHGRHKAEDSAERCQAASKAAKQAQEALRKTERQEYERKADAADMEYKAALADARTATNAYVARNRVRPSGGVSTAQPVSEAGNPGLREEVPASPDVVVSAVDVQGYAECAVYALKARDFILSVGE